jgi:hypothetical protein
MATNFPGAVDNGTTLPTPTGTNTQNNPDHASLHGNTNLAIIAAETKIGTGSSVPAANTLLFGTGAGTSSWTALTSAQLAATLSDETGSGSAVFATTPTLVTPKIDTINENTLNNGTTVGGVNLKAGAVTATSLVGTGIVSSTNLAAASITNAKLATTTGELGGAWGTWTPVLTNLSIGNGSTVAAYTQIGKSVFFRLKITFGTTTSVSGIISFSLPVTANANENASGYTNSIGYVGILRQGTGYFLGHIFTNGSATVASIAIHGSGGTYTTNSDTSSTVPATWGSTDIMAGHGFYEGA